ncbi:hypothetical protein GCM10022393_28270 [Aquimarina addita]|uniref:Replication protein n=1 Tax=Aquimarina addita TaxID=870485 RepID=A0ABP6UQC2_9FLAO
MKEQTYFIHYEKLWKITKEFNDRTTFRSNEVKGSTMDTVHLIFKMYEKMLNGKSRYMSFDEAEIPVLKLVASKIGKLTGYEGKTIKDHITKIKRLNIILINNQYYENHYTFKIPLKYFFTSSEVTYF